MSSSTQENTLSRVPVKTILDQASSTRSFRSNSRSSIGIVCNWNPPLSHPRSCSEISHFRSSYHCDIKCCMSHLLRDRHTIELLGSLFQLLQDERCLLAIQNANGEIKIFLERNDTVSQAIQRQISKKTLHTDKIGHDFLLTYDETKRMLAVCATEKVGSSTQRQLKSDRCGFSWSSTSSCSTKSSARCKDSVPR